MSSSSKLTTSIDQSNRDLPQEVKERVLKTFYIVDLRLFAYLIEVQSQNHFFSSYKLKNLIKNMHFTSKILFNLDIDDPTFTVQYTYHQNDLELDIMYELRHLEKHLIKNVFKTVRKRKIMVNVLNHASEGAENGKRK